MNQNSGQWLKVRGEHGEVLAYGVPSATRPNLYHFADASGCTCPAGQYGQRCWHTKAVADHLMRSRTRALAAKYVRIFGED